MGFFSDEPTGGELDLLRERLAADPARADSLTPHYVFFEIWGGINRAHFSFVRADGSPVYLPKFASLGMAKYISTNQNQSIANLLTDDYYAASRYDIRAGEYLFDGSSPLEKAIWAFGIQMLLPHSITHIVRTFRSRKIARDYTAPGSASTPTVKLWENYLVNGQVNTRELIRKTLTAEEMKQFSYNI